MKSRFRLFTAAAALAAAAAAVPALSAPANAASTPTPVDAWYMYGTTTSALNNGAYNDGCSFASKQPGGTRLMMLDFGAARNVGTGWGAIDFSNTTFSNGQILTALENASNGVHNCFTTGYTIITYGNSNYHMSNNGMSNTDAYNVGYYQESRAHDLANYESSNGRVYQRAAAGSDMEPAWDGPGITKQLVTGATAYNYAGYYDYGSADGCPSSGSGGSCSNGWSVSDVGYASYHGAALSLPEIYFTVNASQWTVVRRNWGSYTFYGTTGTYPPLSGGLTPRNGWNTLAADNPGLVGQEISCYGC
jgi:hypothetical protein